MKTYKFICKKCGKPLFGNSSKTKYCLDCLKSNCDWCKKPIKLNRKYFNKKFWLAKHFCSKNCRYKFQATIPFGLKGDKNWGWKGGRNTSGDGYIKIYKPNYIFCDKKGYILEHRYIMELFLKRKLENWEQVHHKDKNKKNNKLENLQLVVSKNHYGELCCPNCNYKFLIK